MATEKKSAKLAQVGRVHATTDSSDEDEDVVLKKPTKLEAEEAEEAPVETVKLSKKDVKADLVEISCFVDVDPAPTVGHPAHGGYSFIEHGVMKLEARKNYIVPSRVAEHLVDKKVASLVNRA